MTYMWKTCGGYVEDVWCHICGRRVVPYMWKTCGDIYVEDGYVEDVW